jgi:hypothetical protein
MARPSRQKPPEPRCTSPGLVFLEKPRSGTQGVGARPPHLHIIARRGGVRLQSARDDLPGGAIFACAGRGRTPFARQPRYSAGFCRGKARVFTVSTTARWIDFFAWQRQPDPTRKFESTRVINHPLPPLGRQPRARADRGGRTVRRCRHVELSRAPHRRRPEPPEAGPVHRRIAEIARNPTRSRRRIAPRGCPMC